MNDEEYYEKAWDNLRWFQSWRDNKKFELILIVLVYAIFMMLV